MMSQNVIDKPLSRQEAQDLLYEGNSIVNKGKLSKWILNEYKSSKYLNKIEFVD